MRIYGTFAHSKCAVDGFGPTDEQHRQPASSRGTGSELLPDAQPAMTIILNGT
jgi:hypothetical protein